MEEGQEPVRIFLERDDVVLKQSGSSSRDGEKGMDSGYVLEGKPAVPDGLAVVWTGRERNQDDCWVL